jgi:hypothetical protein
MPRSRQRRQLREPKRRRRSNRRPRRSPRPKPPTRRKPPTRYRAHCRAPPEAEPNSMSRPQERGWRAPHRAPVGEGASAANDAAANDANDEGWRACASMIADLERGGRAAGGCGSRTACAGRLPLGRMTLLQAFTELQGGLSVSQGKAAQNTRFVQGRASGRSGQWRPRSHAALACPTSQQRVIVLSDCVVGRCGARGKLSSFKVEVFRS